MKTFALIRVKKTNPAQLYPHMDTEATYYSLKSKVAYEEVLVPTVQLLMFLASVHNLG